MVDKLIDKDEVYEIVGACFEVYNTLGHGYLEAVYQEALALEFEARGVPFVKEKEIDIQYKGRVLAKRYVADFICFNRVIVETKAVSTLLPEHQAQALNYLRATGLKVAVLVNFGSSQGIQWKRLVF